MKNAKLWLNVFLISIINSGCASFSFGMGRACPAPPVLPPKPEVIECIGLSTGSVYCCNQTGCFERPVVNNICVTASESQALKEYIDTLERNVKP